MKFKQSFLIGVAVVLLHFIITTSVVGQHSVILPDSPPTPPLPYVAEKDHYSGPACVQMILNSCPDLTKRQYHSQDNIYASILIHNDEPTSWFSDPSGIEGALEDPVFFPCGSWIDYSNVTKSYVLGKMLYYMNTQRYLTPVSIGNGEHWVIVIGYQTDAVPPITGSVTLHNVLYYDPQVGTLSPFGWVSGTAWLNTSEFWGTSHSKPGSSWNNKFISVIEPPEVNIEILVVDWIVSGPILPPIRIERNVYQWLEEIRTRGLLPGPFKELDEYIRIEKPILVKAEDYSYYLVSFKNRHFAAIFNAYNGSFEEIRYFREPQNYVADLQTMTTRINQTFSSYKAELVKLAAPNLRYDPKLAMVGRFSPTWEVEAEIKNARGKKQKMPILLNATGKVIKGVETVKKDYMLEMKKR